MADAVTAIIEGSCPGALSQMQGLLGEGSSPALGFLLAAANAALSTAMLKANVEAKCTLIGLLPEPKSDFGEGGVEPPVAFKFQNVNFTAKD